MKAAMNGVVNVSILDGWWDEGYDGHNGWAIGGRDSNPDEGAQDWSDAQDLYRLLEGEVVPLWYERDAGGLPTGWLKRMRGAAASSLWQFSTTRMLAEYVERMYLPAAGFLAPGAGAAKAARPVARGAVRSASTAGDSTTTSKAVSAAARPEERAASRA
jgi:glucan phosphorylase